MERQIQEFQEPVVKLEIKEKLEAGKSEELEMEEGKKKKINLEDEREFLTALIKSMREAVTEERTLVYGKDEVGITSLLYCPYKHEFRKRFPEIKSEAVAIDDGFRFERNVKEGLKRLFGGSFFEEFELPYEAKTVKGDVLRLRGHLDGVVIDGRKKIVIGIEMKQPQMILLKKEPPYEGIFIFDRENEDRYMIPNPIYKMQAKVQKFILEKMFPGYRVRLFLFLCGLCQLMRGVKKYYVLYEVESASEEDLTYLVTRFVYDKAPRFRNECEYYCPYKEVCPYAEIERKKEPEIVNMDDEETFEDPLVKEAVSLYREYCFAKNRLKSIEKQIKKALGGRSLIIGGKKIGWVLRERPRYDVEKLVDHLRKKNYPLSEFLNVTFSPKKRKLIEKVFPDVLIDKEVYEDFVL